MPVATKEELQERAQLVRIHEANCQIEHPTDEDLRFRRATQIKLAKTFEYEKIKGISLTGPAVTTTRKS